ncbi:unnamed protein product [Rotaria sp. Silwood2]|nr:unnamed protein product [Rotaria sp. Silwood2]
MYSVGRSDVERYHLPLLLLHTPGACNFDDLKTADGQVCQTFMEAAKRRGLLRDDTEYERCMPEAVIFQMPQQLRTRFYVILLYCNPTKHVDLWNSFEAHMVEDFMQHVDAETAEAMALYAIDAKLKEQGRSCSDFGISSPTSVSYSFESKIINKEEELQIGQEKYAMLNQDQRSAADAILASHRKQSTTTAGSCFFIDGPGGTGKTYLYNTLYYLFMGQGVHVMTVAWTGIAASLLPEGRTIHSRFKLPVPILETSASSIRTNSKEAEEIRKTQVFIWDEAPMPYFKVMHLHQNMRTEPGEEEFSNWLIKLGNGELTSNEDDEIELPSSYKMYTSVDEVECEDGDDITNYPTEFLNSLTPSGMPPHKLKLNIGAIVMLLRNLDVHQGLCNGIWLIVRRLLNHTIDCEIATGSIKASRVLIPRITLTPSDPFLPFKLRKHQFPIRLSFPMTINKSQGQTFDRLGLLLPQPVFSHEQLYVVFLRVRSLTSIKVQIIKEEKNSERRKTKIIVFKNIL